MPFASRSFSHLERRSWSHLVLGVLVATAFLFYSRSAAAADSHSWVSFGFYVTGYLYEPLIPPAYRKSSGYKFLAGLGTELEITHPSRWSFGIRLEVASTQIREFSSEARLSHFTALMTGGLVYYSIVDGEAFRWDVGGGGGLGVGFTSYSVFGASSTPTNDSSLVLWAVANTKISVKVTDQIFAFLGVEGRIFNYRNGMVVRELNAAVFPVWFTFGASRAF